MNHIIYCNYQNDRLGGPGCVCPNYYVKIKTDVLKYKDRVKELGYQYFADFSPEYSKYYEYVWLDHKRQIALFLSYKPHNSSFVKITSRHFFGDNNMFKEHVAVKINGDPQRYINRAKELGFQKNCNYYRPGRQNYLSLFVETENQKTKQYNISEIHYFCKLISEEEFFGVQTTMLKPIDLDVLNVLVELTCETLDSFSAYDVTNLLRKRLPTVNIGHDTVKTLVNTYAQTNNLTVHYNGTYRVFVKNSSCQSTTKQTSLTCFPNYSQPVNKQVTNLQTEYRINLTEKLQKAFPGYPYVNLVRSPNKLVLIPTHDPKGNTISTNGEVRIRTGFTNSRAQVTTYSDKLEIIPLN